MEKIKTLANCTDVEFLRQTNKIRHAVKKWIDITDIVNIRKRKAELVEIPKGTNKAEAQRINESNMQLIKEQGLKNFDAILDSMLEEHPEETLEIIRLCCFVDPKDDTHKVTYYLEAFTEMLNDENVVSFFTSLQSTAQKLGLTL